jgi:hypothetical protein
MRSGETNKYIMNIKSNNILLSFSKNKESIYFWQAKGTVVKFHFNLWNIFQNSKHELSDVQEIVSCWNVTTNESEHHSSNVRVNSFIVQFESLGPQCPH